MERENAWKKYSKRDENAVMKFSKGYVDFISDCKTERECAARAVEEAEAAGYMSLATAIEKGTKLKAGDKVYASSYGKTIIMVQVGKKSMEEGFNILGAHIDSPRLDIKQNPVYESNDLGFLDTHYYGGIKTYQWVTMPLAVHGVVAKKDGSVVDVVIGEDPADPVFCITDLLPHLGADQMKKVAREFIGGEELDVLIGGKPLASRDSKAKKAKDSKTSSVEGDIAKIAESEAVKATLLTLLHSTYGITEEDFLSAELEVVPAGRARDLGFDRSMVIGYGQDDRVCAYTSLVAQLEAKNLSRTAVCVLVDKEEIGSVGATGMHSLFFENTMAEVMALAGYEGDLPLRRALAASDMLSSDVSAGFDPAFAGVYEAKNTAFLGRGVVFNKFTGAGGKSGSNDANAEYIARIRKVMDDAKVSFQTAELGRVGQGGGGTIAYILAKYGMNVIDCGVAVLSMHAPWEVVSKADVYEAYKGYKAFLKNM